MARHQKQNGSITIKGVDGKITGNISGGALAGPGAAGANVSVASPVKVPVGLAREMRAIFVFE